MEKILTQILLIEDNYADVLLLREALEQDALVSFRVTTTDRLKTGIKFLGEIDFDAILLDLGLPDSQGLDTFIRLHKEAPDIPIVILSGLTDEDLALQAIQFGAQDYLVKRQESWETAARTIRYAMERQRSQIALRESENRFRALFEHSPVAYQALDIDGKFVDFNSQLCELLGYEPHELMGESFDEFWSPETRATFPRKFDRFKRDGKMEADLQLVKKDGSVIEVLVQGKIQYNPHGDITKIHCILHDITSRKIAEQALRETQERFSAIFRSNPLSISITEPADGTIIDANESFLNMFGYTRAEALRHTTLDLNIWQNLDDREENLKKLRRYGEVTNTELKFRRKTGEIINALASYRLIELNGKQYVLNMLNDITDHKQTKQALNDNEKRFNALLENGLDNISLITAEGVLLWESPATVRDLDYEPNQFVGRNIFELLHPDDQERVLNQFADLVQKPGSRQRDSFRLRHSDGSWRWVEAVATNLLNEPSVNAIVINYHDITERKQAEEKIRDGEEQLRGIFENATIGIFQSTPDGRFLKVNPAMAKIYGYASPDEMLASITDIASQIYVNSSDREKFIRPLIEKGEIHDFICENLQHGGSQIWTQSSARAVKDSTGKLLYYEGFIREISDRKQAQTETEKYAEDLALINSLNEAVDRGKNLNQILGLLVNECRSIFQARDAGFYMLSPDRKNLILEQLTMPEALRGKVEKLVKLSLSGIRIPISPNSHYYDIERARDGSITNDPKEIQAWADEFVESAALPDILLPALQKLGRKLLEVLEIGSVLSIPFHTERESIGLLQLTSTHEFAETDLQRLKNIRDQVAAIILRKQTAEALQSSEIRWQTLMQNLPAFIAEADPDGIILMLNQVQPGFSLDDYIGHSLFDVVAPDSRQRFRQAFAQVLAEATMVEYEAPGYGPNREPAWYHRQLVPIIEHDKVRSVLIVARDITELKHGELESKRSSEELTALYETTKDLALELNVPKLLEQIIERTNILLESSGGFIYLYDVSRNNLVLTVATNLSVPLGTSLKIGEGMAGRVALTREPMIVDNYQQWQNRADVFKDQPFRSIVEVPMLSDGELIGVLGVEALEGSTRIFNETDARLLSLFAGYAASAVRNARLLEETKAHIQQLDLLYDAGLILNRELDSQNQLDLLFRSIQRALNADNSVFFRYDDTQRELSAESGVGAVMELAEIRELKFTLGEERGLVGWVAQNRTPFYLADVQMDVRWVNIDSGIHSVLWVPVEYEKRLLGVLSVASTRVDAFSKQDQQLVVLFANQIAVAMEKAHLFDALQNELAERRQAEQALSQSESLYRQAIEVAGAVPYYQSYYDNGQRIKYEFIGEGIRDITGYGPEEFTATLWDSLILDIHLVKDLSGYSLDEAIQRVRSGENPIWRCEHRIRHRNGEIRWVFEAAVEVRDEHGVSHGSIGMYQDITERKQAESALHRNEERYRGIFEGVQDAILVESLDGRILDVNQRACEMYGYSREQFLTKRALDLVPVGRLPVASDESGLQEISQQPIETIDVRANGEEFPVEISGKLYDFEDEKVFLVVLRDITKRKQAQEALLAEQQRVQKYLDVAGVIMLALDQNGTVTLVNQKACEILGYPYGEVIGKDWLNTFLPPAVMDELKEVFQSLIAGNEEAFAYYESPILTRNGEERLIAWRNILIKDNNGAIISTLSSGEDITERKQAETALRESERRYRDLFEDMPIAIWEEDFSLVKIYLDSLKQQGITNFQAYFESQPEAVTECAALVKILDVNNATLEMYRIDGKQELFNLKQVLSADALMNFRDELISLANGKTKFDLEGVDHRSDGERIEINLNWAIVPGYEADLSKVIVSITDITERKLAEKALQESERRFRTLINQIPAIVYIDNPSTNPGRTEFLSPYIETMLGYTPDEWIQGGEELWKDQLHPDDRERVLAEYKQSIENDEPLDLEYRVVAKDERVMWVHDQATTLRDGAGNPSSVHGVMYNITESKQAELSLRESEQRFRSLFNTSPDAIVLIDPHDSDVPWRVLDCNETACKMNGYTRAELVGQSVDMLNIAPSSEEERQAFLDRLRRKGVLQIESTHRHKDGHIFPIEIAASLLTIGGRELALGIHRDITERKRTESERQALLEIMRGAISTDDLLQYLNIVHYSIANVIQAENFFVILHNKDTGLFEEIYSVDQYDTPQPPSKLEKSISAYVYRSGKPLLLSQALFEELAAQGEVELVGTNSPSWLGIPLITSTEIIGVMVVQDYENPDRYSESDTDFLVSIAGQVALAVQRKQSEAEINHQLSELEVLYENGLAISRMLEPKQIAHRIVQVLNQKMKWHHAAVRILQQESGRLELLALSQPGLDDVQINEQIERLNQFIINQEYGLSGWVIKHRTAIRSGNLKENLNYVETYPGIQSGLYVPIRSGEEIIGSIAVESEQENAFAERDERLLITLANQAAISFVNARLYLRIQYELSERSYTEEKIRKLNTELEQRVQERTLEIETAHQRLELATASSGIGVWELKSGRDTFYWDERMHGIYGTAPDHFNPTLSNWLNFIHPDDRQAEEEKRRLAITQAGSYESEFRVMRADGSMRYINSHAVVLVDEARNFKNMIGVNMDITTIKQAEETLRRANNELERALRVKDEFLANMSHELRTPLNAILGLSESLEEQIAGLLNEKQQKYVHTISESGHHLLTLINDILDLAKIEAGQIKLDINKMDVHAVCQSSLRMIKQLAQKKNQHIELDIDDHIDLIWADERRLKQMIVNLLSNAVKFTPEGGKIGLEVDADKSDNQIVITVWDSGIGIKDSDLMRLFQPFVQLDSSLSRESAGTGLGLALVAQMARLHGGSVGATSQLGVGSRFTITLPWEPALAMDTISRMKITGKFRVLKPGSESNRRTILLVEDTEEVVMMVRDYLESAAYKVVTATNGMDGITQAQKIRPDLILMDVQMPGMDGLEATQILRRDPDFQHTPIIALTALAMSNDRERCLAAGMDEYISKPVNLKALVKIIQSFLATNEESQP